MKKSIFLPWFKLILVLSFAYSFIFAAAAQNYYPADVGNTWVLEDADVKKRLTYSLGGPETFEGTEVITLKIETKELSTGDLDTDKYYLTVGNEDIKLHGTVLQEDSIGGTVTTEFRTPATFFPLNLSLGDKWQIVADAKVKAGFLKIGGKSTTNLKVVGFEDLETPAGTFQNCAKVELALVFSAGGFINIKSTTYQWLAPNVGPVQYRNSDGLLFQLVSSNLSIEPDPHDVNADGIVNILDLTFVAARFGETDSEADVTGDGTVNILDLVRIAQNFSS